MTVVVPALLVIAAGNVAGSIHAGADAAAWTPNSDGGHAPAVTPTTIDNRPALRFTYTHQPPGWGNAAHPVAVPSDAYARRQQLQKIAARPGAVLHVWLVEPDGDMWVARVVDADGELADWPPGPRVVDVPLARMQYQPRGNRDRQPTTAHRLLLGFNGGDAEIALTAIDWLIALPIATTTRPPGTSPPTVKPGRKVTVALFADAGFAAMRDANCAPANAAYLASLLERAGYGTAMLNAEHLADPDLLTAKRFPLLILPYGPNYPAAAEPAIRGYLMHGGGFLSTGGYVFDRPAHTGPGGEWVAAATGRLVTAAQLNKADAYYSFNTRFGRPGDTMMTRPDQIGAFDPAFVLERVEKLVPADDQFLVPAGFEWTLPVSGYAARSMIAKNSPVFPDLHARTIPLIEARDAFGRPRGPVGSIACVFDGPYRGSAWAFCGVTSHDLFAPDSPRASAMADLFLRTVDALLARRFLIDLSSDLACYHDEPTLRVSARLANFGPEPLAAEAQFLLARQGLQTVPVSLKPGEIRTVEVTFARPDANRDCAGQTPTGLHEFTAELVIDSKVVDRLRSAFVVWQPDSHPNETPVSLEDNYFHRAGRAAFLTGTNTTGAIFYSLDEHPLTWDRDFADMADAGLSLLRILHFSPFAHRGYQGEAGHTAANLAQRPPERLIRQMDAIVQLARAHGLVIFLTLHDWLPVALTDAELDAERTWNRFWVARYRDIPNIIYDIQNEPHVAPHDEPAVQQLWEGFLVARYGSLDAAWQAWSRPGSRPDPIPLQPAARSPSWQDLHVRDADRFRHYLLERWLDANAQGIREGDPNRLFTIGLLQTPAAADPAIASRAVAFSNCHFYGDIHHLAAQLKFIDRRAYGKSLSLGEFGSIPMHDCRVNGCPSRAAVPPPLPQRPAEVASRPLNKTGPEATDPLRVSESITYYLNVGHYALGLGAGFICNWSFKDFAGTIFPWGIRHVGQGRSVPKDVMLAYRNFSLLARQLEPVYQAPELALLLPDGNRFGAHAADMQNALYASVTALIRLGVPFNVINEEDLAAATLPTKAILWPCPYAVDDDAFARVLSFVKNGGHLYLSGSVAFSIDRKPTRRDRAAALGLLDMSLAPPWPRESASKPQPAIGSVVAKGNVYYIPWPVETAAPETLVDVYRRFCDGVPIRRVNVQPDDAMDSVFRLPTKNGEALIIVRRQNSAKTFTATVGTLSLELRLEGTAPAMVWVENGRLRAASLKGTLTIRTSDGPPQTVITSEGLAAVVALSANTDPADLRTAAVRLILPFEAGHVTIPHNPARGPCRVQLGDVHDGRWLTLRTDPAVESPHRIDVTIDPDTALDLRLIAPAAETRAAKMAIDAWLR